MQHPTYALAAILATGLMSAGAQAACPDYMAVSKRKLHSTEMANLCDLTQSAKAVLVVNTASHCGYTRQFKGLETLYKTYSDQGLVVLGFPSDSFNQEAADEEAVATVCYKNYGVTFPMFEEVAVKGDKADPLWASLADKTEAPGWNFNKYLIKDGVITHFESKVEPMNSDLETAVKAALADKAS